MGQLAGKVDDRRGTCHQFAIGEAHRTFLSLTSVRGCQRLAKAVTGKRGWCRLGDNNALLLDVLVTSDPVSLQVAGLHRELYPCCHISTCGALFLLVGSDVFNGAPHDDSLSKSFIVSTDHLVGSDLLLPRAGSKECFLLVLTHKPLVSGLVIEVVLLSV